MGGREGFAEGPTRRLLKREREPCGYVGSSTPAVTPMSVGPEFIKARKPVGLEQSKEVSEALWGTRSSPWLTVALRGSPWLTGKEMGSKGFEQRGAVVSPTFLKAPLAAVWRAD